MTGVQTCALPISSKDNEKVLALAKLAEAESSADFVVFKAKLQAAYVEQSYLDEAGGQAGLVETLPWRSVGVVAESDMNRIAVFSTWSKIHLSVKDGPDTIIRDLF